MLASRLERVSDAHTTGDAQVGNDLVGARAIIAHTNLYFEAITYPGSSVTVAAHDEIAFE